MSDSCDLYSRLFIVFPSASPVFLNACFVDTIEKSVEKFARKRKN